MANRYASQQLDTSFLRASADAVVACTPMTSLAAALGLGAAGYLVLSPGLAASGAAVAAGGLFVERVQARSLRRRRRAERMRNRHEVTQLRRTIAQLRLDVDAFHRALLDTEAALTARGLPLLPPVPAAVPTASVAVPVAPAAPVPVPVSEPVAVPVAVADPAPAAVAVRADASPPAPAGESWVRVRPAAGTGAALPAQQPSPFVADVSGPIPVVGEPLPRRASGTGGVPVLDPAPRDALTGTTDALVHAALDELDDEQVVRDLALAGETGASRPAGRRSA